MKSKVYFTNMRAPVGTSLLKKMEKLIYKAGVEEIDFQNKFAAIKIHFGEKGNLAFLRPNFARVVVDVVKKCGGKPFLTDANTLYVGYRKNAVDHLQTAYENGFGFATCGCPVIIADGLKGTDEVIIPLSGTKYVKEAKIGKAVADADIVISLNHFKGHEMTGFGGAIKNLGMGCGSRAGKMEQHCSGKPCVNSEKCKKCKVCAKYCAHEAISYDASGIASINHDKCVGCGRCLGSCNFDAIYNPDFAANKELGVRMNEYTKAVIQGKPHFHITLVMQVSPYCDCHGESDTPIIPDVGIFASFDPVALDKACVDACNKMPIISGSMLDECGCGCKHSGQDHFSALFPETSWKDILDNAQELGLGTQSYELIEMKV